MAETIAQMTERRRRERQAMEEQEQAQIRARRGGSRSSAQSPATRLSTGYRTLTGALREGSLQFDTAARALANTVSAGGADSLAAGLDSLTQTGNLSRYQANLNAEHARNQYDAQHRQIAQHIGQTIGVILPFAGPSAAFARLPSAAAISARELAAMAAAGGGVNAGMQYLTDVATGRAPSVRNELGAVAGGAAGAVAAPFVGAGKAGAVNGAVTSAAQDLLNGRPVSLDHMGESALLGRAAGHVAGRAGTEAADALSSASKGRLGEELGSARSAVNGRPVQPGSKARDLIGDTGKYWYPDGVSGDTRFEYKFGPWARLSSNQTLAQDVLGQDFQLYHFLPQDVGAILSVPAAGMGVQADPRLGRR